MSTTAATRPVGVDIQESETNRSVVEAIELTNEGCTVQAHAGARADHRTRPPRHHP